MGFTGTAHGSCLPNAVTFRGQQVVAVWPDQEDGAGTTHQLAAFRTLCVVAGPPPRTIVTYQCADWYLRLTAGGPCDLLAGSYSGDMVE